MKTPKKWTDAEKAEFLAEYPRRGLKWCAERFGVPTSTVRSRASKAGLRIDQSSDHFKEWQARAASTKVGRKRPDQALVMRRLRAEGKLEMTDAGRAKVASHVKRRWAEQGHPRGMLGKHHTAEVRERMATTSAARWEAMSADERDDACLKSRTARKSLPERQNVTWKGGWRTIGGTRAYFRSRWEANYARILEIWKQAGAVKSWEHEPETFWFNGIKRGCVSYLPDFRVVMSDGTVEYHEVKGWMDDRSKTKIARMARYHPQVTLRVIDGKAYKTLLRSYGAMLGADVPEYQATRTPKQAPRAQRRARP